MRVTAALVVAWDLGGTTVLGGLGVLIAQQLRRRTALSIHNVYLVAAPLTSVFVAAAATRWWQGALAMWPLAAGAICAAVTGRGWRLSDLGAVRSCVSTSWLAAGSGRRRQPSRRESGRTSPVRARSCVYGRGRRTWSTCR